MCLSRLGFWILVSCRELELPVEVMLFAEIVWDRGVFRVQEVYRYDTQYQILYCSK